MRLTLDDIQVMLRGLTNHRTWIVVGWIDSGHVGVSCARHDRRLPWAMRVVRRELGPGARLVEEHRCRWLLHLRRRSRWAVERCPFLPSGEQPHPHGRPGTVEPRKGLVRLSVRGT
jgi:hypothetical protein